MQQTAAVASVARNRIGCVKVAEAARKLDVHRATLGRYLKNYPELMDERGQVDFEQLVQHRGDNPRIGEASGAAEAVTKPRRVDASSRTETKTRLEEIRLLEAERDWGLSIGKLVDPAEIMDAITDVASALRDKMMVPEHVLCERLAEERDPRAINALLREANRAALEEAIAGLSKLAAQASANGPA